MREFGPKGTGSATHITYGSLIFEAEVRQVPFAQPRIDLLCEANAEVARQGAMPISQARQRHYRKRYDAIIEAARGLHPPEPRTGQRGRAKQSDTVNLLRRLHDHADDVLRFLADPRVSFDNNRAERDIRMPKLKQKVSGAFRTPEGAATFCTIRSYRHVTKTKPRSLHVPRAHLQRRTSRPYPLRLKALNSYRFSYITLNYLN